MLDSCVASNGSSSKRSEQPFLFRLTPLYLFGNGTFPRKSQRRRKATRKRKANRQAKNARTMDQPSLKKLLIRKGDHGWRRLRMKMRRLCAFYAGYEFNIQLLQYFPFVIHLNSNGSWALSHYQLMLISIVEHDIINKRCLEGSFRHSPEV